jgi:MFS family permease
MKKLFKINLNETLPPKLRSLYYSRILRDVGAGLVGIFGPIFLYQISGSIVYVLWTYFFTFLICVLVYPALAKMIKFASLHVWMIVGTVSVALMFFSFYVMQLRPDWLVWATFFFVLFGLGSRIIYWVPYHVDFVRFMDKHHGGKEVSLLSIFISLFGVLLPIFSAFIIERFGFEVLFVICIFVILLSIFPALTIAPTRAEYEFGYKETYRKLFSKKHIKTNVAFMADGFQGAIGSLVWSIFIFSILEGKFMQVGLVSAAIVLATCILNYLTGNYIDKFTKRKKNVIWWGTILYAAGWVLKAMVATAWQVFFVGAYHNFVSVLMRTPFDTLMYEIAADRGHYVDEFTVMREMALYLGRLLMVVIALLVLNSLGFVWMFVIGAIMSLFMNFLSKEEFHVIRD